MTFESEIEVLEPPIALDGRGNLPDKPCVFAAWRDPSLGLLAPSQLFFLAKALRRKEPLSALDRRRRLPDNVASTALPPAGKFGGVQ
jgi:hypothetical protein